MDSSQKRCQIACLIIVILLLVWLISEWLRVNKIWHMNSFSRWYVNLPMAFQIVFGCAMAIVSSILLFCHQRQPFCYLLALFGLFFLMDLSFRYRDHDSINLEDAFQQRGHNLFFLLLLISIIVYFISSFKHWIKDLVKGLIVMVIVINIGIFIFLSIQRQERDCVLCDSTGSWFGFLEFVLFILLLVWLWYHHHEEKK